MSIYQRLKEAGIPISNHCSDLYCKVTRESTRILSQYEYNSMVRPFRNNNDGAIWYDIPFAFDPYWQQRGVSA